MDIPKQVEHFNALSNDTKKLKVLEMLRQLQSTHKTFEMFYKTINSIQEIDDKMLVYIYQSILEIAEDLSL
ncbi:MAG: hypothetical protein WCG25_07450 [bacterium]